MSNWISVEERLPDNYVDVIIFDPGDGVQEGCFVDRIWFSTKGPERHPTHWQPLPELFGQPVLSQAIYSTVDGQPHDLPLKKFYPDTRSDDGAKRRKRR